MSVIGSNVLAGASGGAGAGAGDYQIDRSLRFNSDDTAFLSRDASSASTTYTFSTWIKRAELGSFQYIFASGVGGVAFNSSDALYVYDGSTVQATTAVFRDTSAWYHLVFSVDSESFTLYVNGENVKTGTAAALDTTTGRTGIGRYNGAGNPIYYLGAYLADIHFIDGQALDETSFGEFDDNGVWQPIIYSGTYGTNGCHLDFSDTSGPTSGSNAGIGKDVSGNGNYFDSTSIDPAVTNNGVNIDVTSTPFTDIGSGITVTNPDAGTAVSTTTAATNSFNLTTVADVGAAGTFKVGPTTIPTDYTIDYYFRTSSTQPNNAKAIYSRNSGDNFAPVDDWTNGTTSTQRRVRLHDGSGHTDYSYSVTDDAWNHVRITKTNIWVNGTSITSSPKNIGGIAVREFELGGDSGYEIDGEIGPFRMVAKDLGAPPAGGLVANSDGTLPNESAPNPDTDSFIDSPTNYDDGTNVGGNYATLNCITEHPWTFSNGNLECTAPSSPTSSHVPANIFVNSGKWYAEVTTVNNTADHAQVGVVKLGAPTSAKIGYNGGAGWEPERDRRRAIDGTGTSPFFNNTYTDDVIVLGLALDMDDGTLDIYVNGTLEGELISGLSGYYTFAVGDVVSTQQPSYKLNFGQRAFQYPPGGTGGPPSDYKSLCTQNLSNPTIADGSTVMDAVIWNGDGVSGRDIPGLSFAPDLIWIKHRTSAIYWNVLFDTIRGGEQLSSNQADAGLAPASNVAGYVSDYNSDGFELTAGNSNITSVNALGGTYVGWSWDAGTSDTDITAVYNQSQSWSGYMLTPNGGYGWAKERAFNAQGDYAETANNGETLDFNSVTGLTASTNVFVLPENTASVSYTVTADIGGTTYTDSSVGQTGVTFSYTGNVTRITVRNNDSNSPTRLTHIKVDNKELIDQNITVTQPTVDSTYRANTSAGFSIVSYIGNGAQSANIGHGLNAAPEMIMVKNRDVNDHGVVYHVGTDVTNPQNYFLTLFAGGSSGTNARSDTGAMWNDTAPTSSLFSVGTEDNVNASTENYIAYCWTSVEGYSAFGSYTGNGLANGPFVYTGFRPKFVIRKRAEAAGGGWYMIDTARDIYNVADTFLDAADADDDGTGTDIDILSNGFKLRNSAPGSNASSGTYIYAAFAENPFKTARAR